MAEEQQNLEIPKDMMDKLIEQLLASPQAVEKLVNALGDKIAIPDKAGFCNTAKMGFPQLSKRELEQKAKAMNKAVSQEELKSELSRMGVK